MSSPNMPPAPTDTDESQDAINQRFGDIMGMEYPDGDAQFEAAAAETESTGEDGERFGFAKKLGGQALELAMKGSLGETAQDYAGKFTKAQDMWENRGDYARQAVETAKTGVLETGKAGLGGALDYVLNYYGFDKKADKATGEEKIRLKRALKFGRRVMRTFAAPELVGLQIARGAAMAARGAATREAMNQVQEARSQF